MLFHSAGFCIGAVIGIPYCGSILVASVLGLDQGFIIVAPLWWFLYWGFNRDPYGGSFLVASVLGLG